MPRSSRPLVALVIVFVLVGILYGLTTPPFEAPDEVWHVAYVRYVAKTGRLPIQGERQGEELAQQEASQPPLYYMLGAPLIAWLDTDDFDRVARLNPHAAPGLPHSDGNKNMVIPAATSPWQGSLLAVRLLRLLSLFLGLVTVLCAYDVGQHLFLVVPLRHCLPHRLEQTSKNDSTLPDTSLPLMVAALVAFNPQFLFITTSVNNDNLMTALASVAFALLIRMAVDPSPANLSYRRIALLGVISGLAAISKLTGVLLIGYVLIALALVAWRWQQVPEAPRTGTSLRWFGISSGLIVLLALAIAGWWYARNWLLYGDISGLQPMLGWVGQRRLTLAQVIGELNGLELSFWAVFGWFNILVDEWVYTILKLITRMALVGLLLLAVDTVVHRLRRYLHQAHRLPLADLAGLPTLSSSFVDRFALCLAMLWLAIVMVGLVRWTAMTPGTQGRLLFPSICAIAALLLAGLTVLIPRPVRNATLGVLVMALAAFTAVVPAHYIGLAYARPAVIPTERVQPAYPVHYRYGDDELELLGYDLDRIRVQPGDVLTVTLYYQAVRPMDTDYSLFIHLWGRNMEWLGQRDSYPGRGSLPTSQMTPGEIIEDRYLLSIAPTATVPARVRLEVGFYDFRSGRRLPATTPNGTKIELPFVGRLKLAPQPTIPVSLADAAYTFGQEAALLTSHVETPPVIGSGSSITVATTWQARAAMTRDYTIFLQLVDEKARVWAQNDGEPQDGEYPTGLWDVGEVVTDTRLLKVPTALPPGRYRIVTGLYLLATGERLRVEGEQGHVPDDWVVVGEITMP